MAKGGRKQTGRKHEFRRGYLVRTYYFIPLGEADGYYFSREQAEQRRQELEEQFPQDTFIIEEWTDDPDQLDSDSSWFVPGEVPDMGKIPKPRLIWPR